jgi:hypothetical protein
MGQGTRLQNKWGSLKGRFDIVAYDVFLATEMDAVDARKCN